MASVDYEHQLNIRLFNWASEISIVKPDAARKAKCTAQKRSRPCEEGDRASKRRKGDSDDQLREAEKEPSVVHRSALRSSEDVRMQAEGVILLRVSIVGTTATEVIAVPYPKSDRGRFTGVLRETLERLHLLRTCTLNLDWITYYLLQIEMFIKFGKRWGKPDHVRIFFFDLKINQDITGPWNKHLEDDIKKACSNRMQPISYLQVLNAKMNRDLEKVEKIEKCLKACPIMVVKSSRGMEEVKSFVEIGALTGSVQDDAPTCPICLEEIGVAYRHATTCCGHKFHKECFLKWMLKRKTSCPMCRYSLYNSE